MTRRNFIYKSSIFTGTFLSFTLLDAREKIAFTNSESFIMLQEAALHKRTWMSFVASEYIWSFKQIKEVKNNLALLARTIAKYEAVSILVNKKDKKEARYLLKGLKAHNFPIELIEFRTDDFWLRDTGPLFVKKRDGSKGGINFNFNGWGNKQEHYYDKKVANFISLEAGATIISSNLVLEGGSIEVNGFGTAILTESSVLNDNRNAGLCKKDFELELKQLLGLQKIIWLKGIKNKDITDAHVDFYARFTQENRILVSRENVTESYDYELTRENITILNKARDSKGNAFEIIIVDNASTFSRAYGSKDFAAGYLGYYICKGAIIMQKFGDKQADKKAYDSIKKEFPNKIIEQISIDAIASGGGTIHCCTQQEPL